ncbi:hypothetical protein SAMN02746065_1216 [Desulfocicer vacuolatum DSM 3385]|uniref:Uncharacterized protein n=1 Tax=Desulfocicer vacuolatum DSM 3385 TaxID=1121400 RepID=A0A1W2DVS4_9BACT|nr:hypothetical protein SAMN02746065_1216 [Desulfocicer vacuolatum DSM 3385]
MLRLCSDSSRSYPGRSALHALIFFCNNSRAGPYRNTKVQASPAVADGDEIQTTGSTCKRNFIAPFKVTCLETGQKSAYAIVAKRRE